jgi:hypothetical protein
MQISHQEIQKYLLAKNISSIPEQIKRLKEEDPVYRLLFQIVDQLKTISSVSEHFSDIDNIPFFKIEEIILNTLANNLDSQDAQKIFNNIYYSEANYQRLLIKISQLVPALNSESVAEMNEISIKSDDEILAGIFKRTQKQRLVTRIINKLFLLWNKIKNISLAGNKLYPRYAFAFVLLIIITLSVHFTLLYYHTSYQLLKARDLLTNNYRIYMKDTPRLSGGYQSSGISMLLAGENNKSYLEQALQYTQKALAKDKKSAQARLLQAQIFMINHEYQKADSVLSQVKERTAFFYNDTGVLKFLKEDLSTAVKYFKLSIDTDKKCKEAYYNLALTEFHLGNKEACRAYLTEYLTFENDAGWRNAAANIMDMTRLPE